MDIPQERSDAEVISRVAWVWRGGVAVKETVRIGECYKEIKRCSLYSQSSKHRADLAVKEAFVLSIE